MADTLGLTPREAEIASLYFVDEYPQDLIAKWLGLSTITVKRCLRSAKQKCPALRTVRRRNARAPRVTPFSSVGRKGFSLDFEADAA